MEKVWEWSSADKRDWQLLTQSFYSVVPKTAVSAVGVINRKYRELRVQLLADDKDCSAYLQRGPGSLRIGIRGKDLVPSDLNIISSLASAIDQTVIPSGKL